MASKPSRIVKKNVTEAKTLISTKCVCCLEDIAKGLPSAQGRRILCGASRGNNTQLSTLCAVSQGMANFFELFPKKEIVICATCNNTLLRISSMQEKLRNIAADLAIDVSAVQKGVKPFVKQYVPFAVKRTASNTPAVKFDDSQRIQAKVQDKETKEHFVGGNGTNEEHQHPVELDPVPEKKKKLQQEIQNIAENGYVKIKPRPAELIPVPVRVVGFFKNSWKASESSGSSKDGDGSADVPETLSSQAPEEASQGGSLETAASRVSGQSLQEEAQSNIIEIKPEPNQFTNASETLHSRTLNEPVKTDSINMLVSRVSGKNQQEEIVSNYVKMEPESEKEPEFEKCVTLPSSSDLKQMTVHVSHVIPLNSEEGSVIKQEK